MQSRNNRRSAISVFFYWLLVLVTVLSVVALLLGYSASWISPQSVSWIAYLGLGLQFIILWNLLLLFIWMVILRWWVVIVGLALLYGVGFVGDFVQFSWIKHYQQEQQQWAKSEVITVATYNVHSFGEMLEPQNSVVIKDSIINSLKAYKPDIICFQEYAHNANRDTTKYDNLHSDYPYGQSFTTTNWGIVKTGLTIRSRYPMKLVEQRQFEGGENAMQVVDVTISKGVVIRLFNCHLQSTGFNSVSPSGLRAIVESHDTAVVHNLILTMEENYKRRAVQADTLSKFIAESPYTVIVAGDFNDTPSSYVVKTVGEELSDSFCEAGVGYGATYRRMMGLFRIDYVMYTSDSLKAVEYHSPNLEWSDHRPVISKLIFKNR